MSDDDLFDDVVHDRLAAAAGRVHVDADAEWTRLFDRLRDERREFAYLPDDPVGPRWAPRLLAVAAVTLLLALLVGRPVMRVTVTTARFVQDAVGGRETTTTLTAPSTTTTSTTVVVTVPTTIPPPPTTVPPPPPPTTVPPAAATTEDLAHAPILDGDEYRLTVRRVHNSINAAIGYGNLNFDALAGSDARLERLLGLQPQFDARLRDTIGHLREAQRNKNRDAASQAHTIIESIERELTTEAQR